VGAFVQNGQFARVLTDQIIAGTKPAEFAAE
jgi:hypothetical protein